MPPEVGKLMPRGGACQRPARRPRPARRRRGAASRPRARPTAKNQRAWGATVHQITAPTWGHIAPECAESRPYPSSRRQSPCGPAEPFRPALAIPKPGQARHLPSRRHDLLLTDPGPHSGWMIARQETAMVRVLRWLAFRLGLLVSLLVPIREMRVKTAACYAAAMTKLHTSQNGVQS